MTKTNNDNYFIKVKCILILLYSIQGLIFNFICDSLIFIQKKSLTYTDIGIIKLCTYPFSLKLLWSPFVDTYYTNKIGRRKSWIIPMQLLISLIIFYLYSNYHSIIDDKRIGFYTLILFICFFLLATQDIALDGWALTICRENCTLASATQTIGHKVGGVLSSLIFIQLNSVEFSQKWIYNYFYSKKAIEDQINKPFISITDYFLFMFFYILIATLLILLFPENPKYNEKKSESKNTLELNNLKPDNQNNKVFEESKLSSESKNLIIHTHNYADSSDNNANKINEELQKITVKETIKNIFCLFKLNHARHYIALLFLVRLGNIFFYEMNTLTLVEKGFKRENLALISSLLIPVEFIALSYIESKKDNFYSTFSSLLKYKNILFLLEFIFVCYYNNIIDYFSKISNTNVIFANIDLSIVIVFFLSISGSVLDTLMLSCTGGFFNYITDVDVGATYITALYSISNLSYVFPRYFIFLLMDYTGYVNLGIICLIYNFLTNPIACKSLINIEGLGKTVWKIIK